MSYFTLDEIDASDKIIDGKFTGLLGTTNPYLRGLIYEDDKIVSTSFGFSPAYTPTEEQIRDLCNSDIEITTCFEGPLVKLWWDSEDKIHLSTTKKIDCTRSYWGNKDERFGDLFYSNGGQRFVDSCEHHDYTHHFMIVTPSLMVTTDMDIKDNDCIVVYLGSMKKDGEYVSLDKISDTVFYQQQYNVLPTKSELNSKILYPYSWKVDDKDYYCNFITKLLEYGDYNNPIISSELTMDEKFRGVDANIIKSFFGSPVIIRCKQGIIKFIPPSYEKKCEILGNSPNLNLLVYHLMDVCRPKKDITFNYFENYDFMFVPEPEFIESLKSSKYIKIDIIREYRRVGTQNFVSAKVPKNNHARERNLLMILLLCLPQSKALDAINAYELYDKSRSKIKNFISKNLRTIVDGKYDESLENKKVISRMKDMCLKSSQYALSGGEDSYHKKLQYSLDGLVNNERGASLYRINKAISKFI